MSTPPSRCRTPPESAKSSQSKRTLRAPSSPSPHNSNPVNRSLSFKLNDANPVARKRGWQRFHRQTVAVQSARNRYRSPWCGMCDQFRVERMNPLPAPTPWAKSIGQCAGHSCHRSAQNGGGHAAGWTARDPQRAAGVNIYQRGAPGFDIDIARPRPRELSVVRATRASGISQGKRRFERAYRVGQSTPSIRSHRKNRHGMNRIQRGYAKISESDRRARLNDRSHRHVYPRGVVLYRRCPAASRMSLRLGYRRD